MDLNYLGINHGLGMTVFVYKPPVGHPHGNIGYISDVVIPGATFFGFGPDYNFNELIRTLKEIIALGFNRVIYSHSELPGRRPDGTKKNVRDYLQYALDMREAVQRELEKGASLFAVANRVNLPQYENLVGYEANRVQNAFRFAAEEFLGPFPWRNVKRFTDQDRIEVISYQAKKQNAKTHQWFRWGW